MKENIHSFIETRTVLDAVMLQTNEMLEEKYIRRRATIEKWTPDYIPLGSIIEFDDRAKTFLNIKENTNILETLENIALVIKDKNENIIDYKELPFHLTLEIEKAIIDFFIHA